MGGMLCREEVGVSLPAVFDTTGPTQEELCFLQDQQSPDSTNNHITKDIVHLAWEANVNCQTQELKHPLLQSQEVPKVMSCECYAHKCAELLTCRSYFSSSELSLLINNTALTL